LLAGGRHLVFLGPDNRVHSFTIRDISSFGTI
jgi:hypothetical protein